MTSLPRFDSALRSVASAALIAAALPFAALAQPAGRDPQAVKLLKSATDFLAAQRQFTVDTRSTIEAVLASGQKVQFDNTARASVQRPNKLRAERVGDLVQQVFYYDGRTLTLSNPAQNVYAAVAAPATLDATLEFATTSLNVLAPAGDLLASNAYEILMTDVTSGFVVGKSVVDGARCDHLAFRAPHVDWQIWIEDGKQPLVRKLVITTRDVLNAPQFAVVMKWNLEPAFTAQTFAFSPKADARKIDFLPVGKPAGKTQ